MATGLSEEEYIHQVVESRKTPATMGTAQRADRFDQPAPSCPYRPFGLELLVEPLQLAAQLLRLLEHRGEIGDSLEHARHPWRVSLAATAEAPRYVSPSSTLTIWARHNSIARTTSGKHDGRAMSAAGK